MARFQAAARALDMLGRQQIAGVPTAISELFKNAHDAYAKHVEVDYYHSDKLLVLRDDGIGMTQDEFEQRWLTIGTDSKMTGGRIGMPYRPPGKIRPIMGEKGIGRLAVGILGPQLLVLTRAKRGNELSDLVVAFINWEVFGWPGIKLEEIELPVKVFPGGTLPTIKEISDIVSEFRLGIDKFKERVSKDDFSQVLENLDRFVFTDEIEAIGEPSLKGDGYGTQFFIQPVMEMLEADLIQDSAGVSRISRYLIGFSNTMSPGHAAPDIVTEFREHATDDQSYELIGESRFWSPEDFEECDHSFVGEVDKFGVFEGKIRIYDKEFERTVAWKNTLGSPTECGPFRFSLGTVQDQASATLLPPSLHTVFKRRLDQQAGVYIFRDGLRILPYGDSDFDWLGIEKRRSSGAGHYYFSYRNLFGCVELTRDLNPGLVEKAGREGFRENRAYRELQKILENLFLYFAAEFFRKEAAEPYFEEKRAKQQNLHKAEIRRQKTKAGAQKTFISEMSILVDELNSGQIKQEIDQIIANVDYRARSVKDDDSEAASSELLGIESKALSLLRNIESRITISKPKGFGLSKENSKLFDKYSHGSSTIKEKSLLPAKRRVSQIVSEVISELDIDVDRSIRIQSNIRNRVANIRSTEVKERKLALEVLSMITKTTKSFLNEHRSRLSDQLDELSARIARTPLANLSDEDFITILGKFSLELDEFESEAIDTCRSIRATLQTVRIDRNEDGSVETSVDELESMDADLESLREQVEEDLELTQLGLAFDIINHEFIGSIRSVKRGLSRLENWSVARPEFAEIYRSLNAPFQHLENYLALFTPLQRRMNLKETLITGQQLAKFLKEVFEERLEKTGIELRVSEQFERHSWFGLRSVFYPAFVNIVDNAIYWTDRHPQRADDGNAIPGVVSLDYLFGKWQISDNGPGVEPYDRDRIFELRVSNKPGGRGLGLYISKRVLLDSGFKISVAEKGRLGGATFIIEESAEEKV